MKLTADNVSKVFEDCLFKKEELVNGKPTSEPVVAEGILRSFGFQKDRLEKHTPDIISLLNELPDEFKESKGGGMSFLNACMTKEGHHWGEHANMEQLFALGIAIKRANYCLPRDMWKSLPGGMPYVAVSA